MPQRTLNKKMQFSIKDLLKKSLMENFIFCVVPYAVTEAYSESSLN